jgi:hypothetical protein
MTWFVSRETDLSQSQACSQFKNNRAFTISFGKLIFINGMCCCSVDLKLICFLVSDPGASDILVVQIFQTIDNIFGTCWQQVCEGGKVKLVVYKMDKVF